MLETIGSFIDGIIPIVGGIFILSQLKQFKKPIMKWLGIALLVIGTVLLAMDIAELV